MQEQDFWDNSISFDPFSVFGTWMRKAEKEAEEPFDAAAVASADINGRPSVRIMLLKGIDDKGFIFFTNFESNKGSDFIKNPEAAFDLYWKKLGRQIRVNGVVEDISNDDSDEYFHSRPRGSQIASLVSKQSKELSNRQQFIDEISAMEQKYEGQAIPRPAHWHGFRIVPRYIEFFEEGEYRMHRRRIFTRENVDISHWDSKLFYP